MSNACYSCDGHRSSARRNPQRATLGCPPSAAVRHKNAETTWVTSKRSQENDRRVKETCRPPRQSKSARESAKHQKYQPLFVFVNTVYRDNHPTFVHETNRPRRRFFLLARNTLRVLVRPRVRSNVNEDERVRPFDHRTHGWPGRTKKCVQR